MTKIRTIELDYDFIEVHFNKHLKNKPYLVRVFSYRNADPEELRLEEKDVKDLWNVLKREKLL